jgi:hypothetical protein
MLLTINGYTENYIAARRGSTSVLNTSTRFGINVRTRLTKQCNGYAMAMQSRCHGNAKQMQCNRLRH